MHDSEAALLKGLMAIATVSTVVKIVIVRVVAINTTVIHYS